METQSSQSHVACQIVNGQHGDIVEGEIKGQGTVCYCGNMGKSSIGAVAGEPQVTAIAGWPLAVWVYPLTPAQGDEEDEIKVGWLSHTGKKGWMNESSSEPSKKVRQSEWVRSLKQPDETETCNRSERNSGRKWDLIKEEVLNILLWLSQMYNPIRNLICYFLNHWH